MSKRKRFTVQFEHFRPVLFHLFSLHRGIDHLYRYEFDGQTDVSHTPQLSFQLAAHLLVERVALHSEQSLFPAKQCHIDQDQHLIILVHKEMLNINLLNTL